MIRYALKCAEGHAFESWFRDSSAYDALAEAGQVTCAVCGTTEVQKSIMAPAVSGPSTEVEETKNPLSAPASPAEAALRQLRDHLSKNADYVGKDFATEARRIHQGEADARGIWGEATREDAKALKDEGVPVAPIPFISRTND